MKLTAMLKVKIFIKLDLLTKIKNAIKKVILIALAK